MKPDSKMAKRDVEQGTNAPCVRTRIEALTRQEMPHKSHNIGGAVKTIFWFLRRPRNFRGSGE
ncbi:hypothetical protein PROCOU_05798 [Listeria rocourtiae FSL F6-920]|nr:hypothetical protein PROCOU_05798 [Listeria rocourtiae FSL F6-920]